MGTVRHKSYARIKVWLAQLIAFATWIYIFWSIITVKGSLGQMSLAQVGAFPIFGMTIFYLDNVKCEICKTKWHSTERETYKDSISMLDFTRKFISERNFMVDEKCKACGVERY